MATSDNASLYDPLEQLLQTADAAIGASQWHGLLLGCLCAGLDESAWLEVSNKYLDIPGESPETIAVAASELHRAVTVQLKAQDYGLRLLMPPADLVLQTRLLSEWVEAFLWALGAAQGLSWSQESLEVLEDFEAIANITEADGDEEDLFEVTEYVRLAVYQLFGEQNPAGEPGTVH
jgi:uncharacterized protein YgfB (UPF0149 family)